MKIVPILSGGGTRLPAYIGVLKGLDELKVEFNQMVGVSGGSIIAAMYCAGYTLDQMYKLALETNFKQFKEFSIYHLFKHGGLSSGDKFERWMDNQLKGKTFADLELDLNILATDVNGGGPVIFNKHISPNLKVASAVRFSMSIPLIFSFKNFEDHLLVDGAILSEDALFCDWSGCGIPVFCFRLKSQLERRKLKKSFFPLPQYIMLLIRTFMTTLSREYVPNGYWLNTIVIDTGKTSAVDFEMSDLEKQQLFNAGFQTVLDHLPRKLATSASKTYT
ncbi:MAG: patatin-like phospholipase family protein [Paraglaciecola sp.]|nr:patatin-like phospholipase family protein [Paraglaciecola sp.]